MEAVVTDATPHSPTDSLGTEVRALFTLAWPLALAQAGQALLGLVDTAIVGRVGPQAQGAVGLGNALFIGISVVAIGIMLSLDPLISQALGASEPARARTLYWQGLYLAVGLSAALALPIIIAPLLLPAAGVDNDLAWQTGLYVWWRLPQLLFWLMLQASRSYLQAVGRPRILFVAAVVANVANALLCSWFVLKLDLGVTGAAISTVLSAGAQLALVFAVIGPAPAGSSRKIDRSVMLKMMRVGLPIGLQMAAEVSVFALAGILAGGMGEASIAAHQIAITWASFTFCLAVGVGAAAAVRVGRAIGAKDTRSARRSGFVAIALGVGVMSTSATLFFLFPLIPARAMTERADVLKVVVGLLAVTAVFQVFDGIQAVAAGALRGAGDTRFSFWSNVLGHYCVGLPIALFCGFKLGLGIIGIWWGLCAGLIAVAAALALRFHLLTRKNVAAL